MGAMKCVGGPRDTLWWPPAGGRDDIYSKLFYINISPPEDSIDLVLGRAVPRSPRWGVCVLAAAVSIGSDGYSGYL